MVFRFNRKIIFVTALAVFAVALCLLISCERRGAIQGYATADEVGRYSTEAPDTEAQAEFLSRFGAEIDRASKSADTVIIPKAFNSVYEAYNRLQREIGLDLAPYGGREAERVTYRIKNSGGSVTLLVLEGHIIGGHISDGVYGHKYKALSENYGKTG